MLKALTNKHVWSITILLVVDSMFFSITNPSKGSSFMLIVGFLFLALTIYYIFSQLLKILSFYGFSNGKHSRRLTYYFTGLIAGLLALQTIGELTLKDAVILTPLSLVLYFYVSYTRFRFNS
jgi:hypothetical protein